MSALNMYKLELLCSQFSKLRMDLQSVRTKTRYIPPRYRPPHWYVPKERVLTNEMLTHENKQFIEDILQEKLNAQIKPETPLASTEVTNSKEWDPYTRRTGLLARKIGNYPLWSKDGKKFQTTLVQVVDNHVIKYIPPEKFKPMKESKVMWREKRRLGCLLVGSETTDPSVFTKAYCGMFDSVGMLPKRFLCRFMVSPHAALPTGTPLYATHFRVGDHLDVRAKTIDRGFQGVMKRWGFKGMPASHGVTKTHRRPGNIGSGGARARVIPGTKMPGHMGNRWRTLRGVKVLRINTKHNVLWLLGVGIPGETGAMCYLFDTVLPLKKLTQPPPFPTHVPTEDQPIEYYDKSIHPFEEISITFDES